MHSESPGTIMSQYGRAGWSILRESTKLSVSMWWLMWNRRQRTVGKQRVGGRMGPCTSDLVFHMCPVHENRRERQENFWVFAKSTVPWHPLAAECSLSFPGKAQLGNEMWRREPQLSFHFLSTSLYWAGSTSSGMQNDFLLLPATLQQYFQLWVKLQMPHESFK